jgi:mevalonate kinase
VRYRRGRGPEPLVAPGALGLWIGLTPVGASTREAVAQVAALRAREPERFGALERRAAGVVAAGIAALQAGDLETLGAAMDDNHALLGAIGVSTPTLDGLCDAAREAGALGAKLTGGGLGGAVIALAPPGLELGPALLEAGAQEVIQP